MPVRRLPLSLLLLCACSCARNGEGTTGPDPDETPTSYVTTAVPHEATPAQDLSKPALQHTELCRIARNFGKENFEIALDAWTPVEGEREISEVRLWWARTDRGLERSPFGAKSREHFDIRYERLAPDRWRVDLGSDRKTFVFIIELDDTGTPAAFADVDTDAGNVPHCRLLGGTLQARKLLGAPIGIKAFDVSCVDDGGRKRSGRMVEGRGRD
ncbi:MAG: hypothetical protein IAG13_15775 [Deltaproteobacteria bacterium]|nr:hypothetical protein [Nannocystaceae bacterium]